MFDFYNQDSSKQVYQTPEEQKNINRDRKSHRYLLSECKAVIQEQCDEISELVKQLDSKDKEIQETLRQNQMLTNSNTELEKRNKQLRNRNGELQANLKHRDAQMNKKDMEMDRLQRRVQNLQKQKEMAENQTLKCQSVTKNHLNTIQNLRLKIETLEETVQLMSKQNYCLNDEIHDSEERLQWEISELRKFNQSLKQKFEIFEEQTHYRYSPVLNSSPIPNKDLKRRQKALSTDKKLYKRPNSKQKYELHPQLYPTRVTQRSRWNSTDSVNAISRFNPNPQMSQQLKNIKQQISKQYSVIQTKKTNYKKERALKVLELLQDKATRLISEAQKSDTDSFMD